MWSNQEIITEVLLVSQAKPRNTNMSRDTIYMDQFKMIIVSDRGEAERF